MFQTSCPKNPICFGKVFTDAGMQYPNAMTELNIKATQMPFVIFRSGKNPTKLESIGKAKIFIPTGNIGLVEWNYTVSFEFFLSITNRKLFVHLSNTEFEIEPTFSNLKLFKDGKNTELAEALAKPFMEFYVKKISEIAIKIPMLEKLKVNNHELIFGDRFIVLALDVHQGFDLDEPEA